MPKFVGGLGLKCMALGVKALATKLYWRWCKNQDQDWAKILAHKYFPGVELQDIPRLELDGKGSFIWDALKRVHLLSRKAFFGYVMRGQVCYSGRTLRMATLLFSLASPTFNLYVKFFLLQDGLR